MNRSTHRLINQHQTVKEFVMMNKPPMKPEKCKTEKINKLRICNSLIETFSVMAWNG